MHLHEGLRADEKVGASAGNEAQGVIARLHVLPEVDVGVVEEVSIGVEIVESLWGQHHANILATVKQPDGLDEEVPAGHLQQARK